MVWVRCSRWLAGPAWVLVIAMSAAALAAVAAGPAAAGERYQARFYPGEPETGPVAIFLDSFETGGVCNWTSTAACALYIFTIADGTVNGDHGFPPVIRLAVGATLHIVNGDIEPHRIHAFDTIGLQHQDTSMGQGQEYVGTVTQAGSDTLYCHDHGTGAGEMLVLVP